MYASSWVSRVTHFIGSAGFELGEDYERMRSAHDWTWASTLDSQLEGCKPLPMACYAMGTLCVNVLCLAWVKNTFYIGPTFFHPPPPP